MNDNVDAGISMRCVRLLASDQAGAQHVLCVRFVSNANLTLSFLANDKTDSIYVHSTVQGWRQEFSDRGADSSNEVAKVRLSGYCKCQKSPTK